MLQKFLKILLIFVFLKYKSSFQPNFQYIIREMQQLGWSVETDSFNAKTPTHGTLRFENILAKANPSASQVLVLACHYDSKYFKNIQFVGATDSAVPCAMIMNLAHSLRQDLASLKRAVSKHKVFPFF